MKRILIALLPLLVAATFLPGVAHADGPVGTSHCTYPPPEVGGAYCVSGGATYNGSYALYFDGPSTTGTSLGQGSYYLEQCGSFYSSDGYNDTGGTHGDYIVFYCNYTVEPMNLSYYPRAWVNKFGMVGKYDG